MSLPSCEDCGSKYTGFHKEDCPQITGGKKIITLPFKAHHIAEIVWCILNFIFVPILMIKISPVMGLMYILTAFGIGVTMCSESDNIAEDFRKGFSLIWKIVPKPSHFGYKVKLKD